MASCCIAGAHRLAQRLRAPLRRLAESFFARRRSALRAAATSRCSASGLTASSSSRKRCSSSASQRRQLPPASRGACAPAACSASMRASVSRSACGIELDARGVVAQRRAPPRRPAPRPIRASRRSPSGGRRAPRARAAGSPPRRAAAGTRLRLPTALRATDCAPPSRLEPCAGACARPRPRPIRPPAGASFFSSATCSCSSARSASRCAKFFSASSASASSRFQAR